VLVLVWLGAPCLFGIVLGALLARRGWHFLALLALGILLGFGLLLYAYLVAPPDYSQTNGCSDCEEYLGRWWEPVFVFYIAIFANLAYLVGIGLGALVGVIVRGARGPRPTT
jgi:amino acid permease